MSIEIIDGMTYQIDYTEIDRLVRSEVDRFIGYGAADEETAVRWMLQSEDILKAWYIDRWIVENYNKLYREGE